MKDEGLEKAKKQYEDAVSWKLLSNEDKYKAALEAICWLQHDPNSSIIPKNHYNDAMERILDDALGVDYYWHVLVKRLNKKDIDEAIE